jgi:hypothetical protein
MQCDSFIPFHLVEEYLHNACEKLIQKDGKLFEFDVNERTLTQRLSLYLQAEFPNHVVDCEYNRSIKDKKRLPIGATEIWSDDTKGVTVFPDIVVHQRGSHELNLLVVEAKKHASGTVPDYDSKKLRAFTDPEGVFKYSWGAFLNFYKCENSVKFAISWFWDAVEQPKAEVVKTRKNQL